MRELRLIYEAQSNIHKVMVQMELKLQEIVRQQQQHTAMLQQGGQGAGAVQQQQQVPAGTAGGYFLQTKILGIQGGQMGPGRAPPRTANEKRFIRSSCLFHLIFKKFSAL